ncbi:hypothetical protein [Arcobacter sp. FWKO B]|uniref:hypothetical protein n=1 Tax=Arcobacter sp. FWKO B TaxID=2593672 RepID=UPI0018A5CB85|nr:hypothetical protein [Arcobacter sp. FWKO B]QOG11236.1 hypothetical protein FWKOB_00380 [Arcobacter sp. FWKO B]
MFVCGYHFPASMGNDVSFDKVVEKVTEGAGDLSGISGVVVTGETPKGEIVESFTVAPGTFMFTALVDYYKKSDVPEKDGFKMIYYTNKYQISEVSKTIDGDVTKPFCRKFDDMNLYRIKVA